MRRVWEEAERRKRAKTQRREVKEFRLNGTQFTESYFSRRPDQNVPDRSSGSGHNEDSPLWVRAVSEAEANARVVVADEVKSIVAECARRRRERAERTARTLWDRLTDSSTEEQSFRRTALADEMHLRLVAANALRVATTQARAQLLVLELQALLRGQYRLSDEPWSRPWSQTQNNAHPQTQFHTQVLSSLPELLQVRLQTEYLPQHVELLEDQLMKAQEELDQARVDAQSQAQRDVDGMVAYLANVSLEQQDGEDGVGDAGIVELIMGIRHGGE